MLVVLSLLFGMICCLVELYPQVACLLGIVALFVGCGLVGWLFDVCLGECVCG